MQERKSLEVSPHGELSIDVVSEIADRHAEQSSFTAYQDTRAEKALPKIGGTLPA